MFLVTDTESMRFLSATSGINSLFILALSLSLKCAYEDKTHHLV